MLKSILVGFLFASTLITWWNAYDIEVAKKEIEALNKRLDEKTLLCKQVHTIQSKLNTVIECMEINK
jgi:hypothetical protein